MRCGRSSTAAGRIGDTVFVDANGNGVQNPGEAGLANVTLLLYDNNGAFVGVTTTDASARAGFSVKGIKLNGSIGIKPKAIELELDVPFIFKVFKNRARGVIEGEIANWVARAKAGELGA